MGSFSPDNSIETARFEKQGGRCALCGKEIALENHDTGEVGGWHAHHIDGDRENNELYNCAAVCINDPENCHLNVAHWGDFTSDLLAPRDWFRLEGWGYGDLAQVLKLTDPDDILNFHTGF